MVSWAKRGSHSFVHIEICGPDSFTVIYLGFVDTWFT